MMQETVAKELPNPVSHITLLRYKEMKQNPGHSILLKLHVLGPSETV
jgi:hypothetical protein